MIEDYKRSEHEYLLADYLINHTDSEFYLTHNNQRIFVRDLEDFNIMTKKKRCMLVSVEKGELQGFLLVWVARGGETKRNYVKVNAKNPDIAEKLLSVLCWNHEFEMYSKVYKNSQYLRAYKNKGFRFFRGRGKEILLYREKTEVKKYERTSR